MHARMRITAIRERTVSIASPIANPGKDHAKLQDETRSCLDRGYRVVKMKIGGASLDEDLRRVDAVLPVVGGGSSTCRTLDVLQELGWSPRRVVPHGGRRSRRSTR
jgi:hypothetical protein